MISQAKKRQIVFFVAVVTMFLVGLAKFDPINRIVSAENQLASDFVQYLQKAGYAVALSPDEVVTLADQLMKESISERILYLSSEAASNAKKEVLGQIYEAGILLVAIDTPISVLYEAAITVPLGENAPRESLQRNLEDLTAPNNNLVVVSMIYSYNYMYHVNGYSHNTDFYTNPENVVLVAQAIVNSAEDEYNSIDPDSLNKKESALESPEITCGVTASIPSWTNGSNPGTIARGKAKCGFSSTFKPFWIRAYGIMEHNCVSWHKVGDMDVWNTTPYTVSEVSQLMSSGFPANNAPNINYCGSNGTTHKSPVFGTASVTAEARDYSPSSLQSHSTTSSQNVYYPI